MKKSFYFLVALVVIIVAVVFLVASNLDAIVKKSIEKYGSQATKTAVKVSSVKIKLKDGVGSVRGLRVSNPKGFSSPTAISLGNITIDIDTSTVTKDPVIIEKIHVSEPHLTYEINKSGKSNVDALKSNLGSNRSGAKPSDGTSSGKEKKIIIRDLVIEKGKLDVLVAALGDKANSTTLPTIHLKNLGGEGGSTPSEIALQIIRPLSDRISKAAMNTGIQQYLGRNAEDVQKMLQKGVMDKLGTSGKDINKAIPKEAGDALKQLLGK